MPSFRSKTPTPLCRRLRIPRFPHDPADPQRVPPTLLAPPREIALPPLRIRRPRQQPAFHMLPPPRDPQHLRRPREKPPHLRAHPHWAQANPADYSYVAFCEKAKAAGCADISSRSWAGASSISAEQPRRMSSLSRSDGACPSDWRSSAALWRCRVGRLACGQAARFLLSCPCYPPRRWRHPGVLALARHGLGDGG